MRSTRIVIYALTEKGRKVLAIQKADEIALRSQYDFSGFKGFDLFRKQSSIPLKIRSYLRTVSLFAPKDGNPEKHEILGFKRMCDFEKLQFYNGVKASFKENGCYNDDFEVKFYDE